MSLSGTIITYLILGTLLVNFIIDFSLNFLNLKSIKDSLPEEFVGHCDHEKYKKSQLYLKTTTKFAMFSSCFDLTIILAFWFLKGFPLLDNFVRSFDYNTIGTGLLYLFIIGASKFLLSIPFSIYSTFFIEEKFNFNKTNPLLFITDTLKSFILSIILGGLILWIILIFFESAGKYSWVICWIFSASFIFIIQYIVPTWILPLFNKFTPLENGELRSEIMKYAESINFSLDNIFIMDGSKRSTKSNAFFTGFGKNRRIVLFDTLIQNHSADELVSILAHEMGHFKKKHILQNMSIIILQMGFMFFLLSFFISYQGLFEAFFMQRISIYSGLIFFSILYSPVDFFISIFIQILSRKNEFEADRFALETIGNEKPLIAALKKLSVNNLSNLTPNPLFVFFNYSHPPVLKRIEVLRKINKSIKPVPKKMESEVSIF